MTQVFQIYDELKERVERDLKIHNPYSIRENKPYTELYKEKQVQNLRNSVEVYYERMQEKEIDVRKMNELVILHQQRIVEALKIAKRGEMNDELSFHLPYKIVNEEMYSLYESLKICEKKEIE